LFNGILIRSSSLGIIENCDIFANTNSEIWIDSGGNPTVRRCSIHDSKSFGVYIVDEGKGQIIDCDIFANTRSGIAILDRSNPHICKCKIHNGQSNGVWVNSSGIGTIEDCDIFANAQDIFLEDGAKTVVRDSLSSENDPIIADLSQGNKEEVRSSLEELLEQLDDMIGLGSVKAAVRAIVDTEIANQRLRDAGFEVEESETRHMLFAGNPGTGKTTVARLIGKVFKQLGILKKGTFVETQRNSLVGMYQGHTATQTTAIVESALDGVLFIDEAYSLVNGETDMFGKEAIDTLIALMENYRDRLIVVFAGYPNDMDIFLDSNPGLKSRIPFYIDFPDYTGDEMCSIFLSLCVKTKPGWVCTDSVSERLKGIFANMYEQRGRNFANGRDVRNLFEEMVRQIKTRIIAENLSGDSMRTFTLRDIPSKF
jgi:F-box protein 11